MGHIWDGGSGTVWDLQNFPVALRLVDVKWDILGCPGVSRNPRNCDGKSGHVCTLL